MGVGVWTKWFWVRIKKYIWKNLINTMYMFLFSEQYLYSSTAFIIHEYFSSIANNFKTLSSFYRSSRSQMFNGKHLCYSKWDSNTGVFLWILQSLQLFYRTPPMSASASRVFYLISNAGTIVMNLNYFKDTHREKAPEN